MLIADDHALVHERRFGPDGLFPGETALRVAARVPDAGSRTAIDCIPTPHATRSGPVAARSRPDRGPIAD